MEDHRKAAEALAGEADELEHEADELEHESDRVEEEIDDARSDWEAKKDSSAVPGAVAEREESDQLPEEAPEEQVPDDAGDEARDEAEETPGVPGEDERGTGHQPDEQSGDA